MKLSLRYRLNIVAFVAGAIVMVLEITASRVLAPYTGLSLYVWTSIIGIILAAMSIGYWLGGKAADRNPSTSRLQKILWGAGVLILVTVIIKDVVSAYATAFFGAAIGAIIASVVLFLPSAILLAMVSPYALRLQLLSVETGGRASGNISALSTLGSIVGTFFAGFVLIPHVGTIHILVVLAASSVFLGVILYGVDKKKVILFCVAVILIEVGSYIIEKKLHLATSIPSAYALITIEDTTLDGHPARVAIRDSEVHAGKFMDSDRPAFPIYEAFISADDYFFPNPQRALLLGGGIYVIAESFIARHPTATIDAVEIDPRMTEVAKRFFNFRPSQNIRIAHEDGRVFLNQSKDEHAYDVIYNDSFASFYSVPFQLATKEAVTHMKRLLSDDGIVLANIVSGLHGYSAKFLEAEYKTFRSVFPYVRVFAIRDTNDTAAAQNFLLVASQKKLEQKKSFELPNDLDKREVFVSSSTSTPILTDEFAPTDYYMSFLDIPGHN
jgi:spermidine synthase